MPIDRTPAHHWELMREYHYERWKALDRFWQRYLWEYRRNLPLGGLLRSQDILLLWEECVHHAKCEHLAANKWRSMQAKAKQRSKEV